MLNCASPSFMTNEQKLKEALDKIRKFGYKQSGYGFSCAKMADEILSEVYGDKMKCS